jgi:hypothetical protein
MEQDVLNCSDTAMEDWNDLQDKSLTDFLRHRLSWWCYPGSR